MRKYKPVEVYIPSEITTDYPKAYKLWSIESIANSLGENKIQDIIMFFDKHKVQIELTYFKYPDNKSWYSFDIILGDSGLCLHADPRFYEQSYLWQYQHRDFQYYQDIIKWAFKTFERLLK